MLFNDVSAKRRISDVRPLVTAPEPHYILQNSLRPAPEPISEKLFVYLCTPWDFGWGVILLDNPTTAISYGSLLCCVAFLFELSTATAIVYCFLSGGELFAQILLLLPPLFNFSIFLFLFSTFDRQKKAPRMLFSFRATPFFFFLTERTKKRSLFMCLGGSPLLSMN